MKAIVVTWWMANLGFAYRPQFSDISHLKQCSILTDDNLDNTFYKRVTLI